MIITWRSVLIAAALMLLFVLLQQALFSDIRFLGGTLWLIPVVALSFGLMGGSLPGAAAGFALGLLGDAFGDSPLGVGCLVLMAIGYLAGRYREHRGLADFRTVVGLAALAVLAANLAFAALSLLSGTGALPGWGAIGRTLLQVLFGALAALPVYGLSYRILKPALILSGRRAGQPQEPNGPYPVIGGGGEA